MKIKYALLSLFATAAVTAVAADIPTDPPALKFKSRAGTYAGAATSRKIGFYLKSAEPNATFYVQWGDSTETQEVKVAKANTLTSEIVLKNISKPEMEVKIWGKTINFINCQNDSIFEMTILNDGKRIKEFRCANNPLTDYSFVNDIDSLSYLVLGNEKLLTKLELNSPLLARLDLASQKVMKTLTLNTPKLYEFKISDAANLEGLDFSKCPELKTVSALGVENIKVFDLGPSELLERVTVTKPKYVTSLALKDRPKLISFIFTQSTGLSEVTFENLPLLASVDFNGDNFKSFNVPDLPKLVSVTLTNNPELADIKFTGTGLTTLYLDRCPALKEVDVTPLKSLKNLYLRYGNLEKLIYDRVAAKASMSSFMVMEQRLTYSQLPIRIGMYTLSTNYYAPQATPQVPDCITTGQEIDLSAWLSGDSGDGEKVSKFEWITKFDEVLKEGEDYINVDGKFKFLKAVEDSVRCIVSNEAFPRFEILKKTDGTLLDYRVKTNYMVVDESPVSVLDINADAGVIRVDGNCVYARKPEDVVTVYNISGSRIGMGNSVVIEEPGVYIARLGRKSLKIRIR